jgi:membrane protein
MNAKKILPLLKDTAKEWSDDNAMRLSAALSYYSIFSIAPLLLIVIGIAGKFFANNADAELKVVEYLGNVVGPQVAEAVKGILQSAKQNSNGATIVGFLTLLVGASTVFGQLKEALNTIWGVRPKPGLGIMNFIKQRLLSFGMVLVIGLLLLTSLIMTTAITALNGWLADRLGIPEFVSNLVGFILAFGVETLLFALIFKMLPDAKVEWRSVWIGAAATALLFEVGKLGLSYYLGGGGATSSFGAGAAVVLLLLWVFYASNILFFGAEFTQVYAHSRGHDIQPSSIAEFCDPPQGAGVVASPGTSAAVAVPKAEASPVSEALEPERPTPAIPPKETLEPLLASAPEIEPEPAATVPRRSLYAPPQSKLEEWLEKANLHPFAEIGAAVGTGLVVGILSRMMERRPAPELSAAEHLRIGAKEATAAGATALAALGPRIAREVNSKALKRKAREVKKQVADVSHDLPKQVRGLFR